MAMKSTELHKRKAEKLLDRMKKTAIPGRHGETTVAVDRREQRRLDQAAGLVPFAVKLNRELVAQLHALAAQRRTTLNDTVAELLRKALDAK